MIPRVIVALADEPPPSVWDHGVISLALALAIAGAAIAAGIWLAKRRRGKR